MKKPGFFKGVGASSNTAGWQKMFASIKERDWDKVRKRLSSRNPIQFASGSDSTGLTILSCALGSGAPLEIIELLLKVNPSASQEKDNYGAVPIHVACLNGARFEIVKLLIEHDNGATLRMPDNDNRLPLHHAVEFCARLSQEEIDTGLFVPSYPSVDVESVSSRSSHSSFEEDLEIIRALCARAPETVHHQNNNNDTPLDVAHVIRMIANTRLKKKRIKMVYEILKDTSIQLYRERKIRWEGREDLPPSMVSTTGSGSTVF